jgi:uncharacterized protein YceH (UPF0502 family)
MENPLDDISVRVLGALMEKDLTTPDNYPLTLNALTAACNQTSNRDPVMELDERTVAQALETLGQRSLARGVKRSDSRVERYRHLMSDTLNLHQQEIALLCVLLLRGPQTPGELRTRTQRMFEFIDPSHVEITLQSLMTLASPLVLQLPRQPGQKELRYAHLLAGEPTREAVARAAERTERPAGRIEGLEQEVGALRAEVAQLREQVQEFRRLLE